MLERDSSQSQPRFNSLWRAVGVLVAVWFGLLLLQWLAVVFFSGAAGFGWGNSLLSWLGVFVQGTEQVIAAQAVLLVLWTSGSVRSRSAAVVPFAVALLFVHGISYASGWLQGGSAGGVWQSYRLASHVITMISVFPTWVVAFYAIRPVIDARFRVQGEPPLSRPRGWTIIGLMTATACFAIVMVAEMQTRRWLERLALEPGFTVQLWSPLSMELFKFGSIVTNAIAISFLAAVVWSDRAPHQSPVRGLSILIVGVTMIIQIAMSFGFSALSGTTYGFGVLDGVLITVSSFAGIVFPHAWFFYCWKRTGMELDVVGLWSTQARGQPATADQQSP